mgnify:CR=1 FL=1
MRRWFKYVKPYLSSFILGPVGMIVGPFVGALLGELFAKTPTNQAFRVALYSFKIW